MKRDIFFIPVTFILVFFLQLLWFKYFTAVNPDFLLIFTLYFGLWRGPLYAELFGFFWGLGADSFCLTLFGSQAFLLTVAGFVSGKLSRKFDERKIITQIFLVFISSLTYLLLLFILSKIFLDTSRPFWNISQLLTPVYNALLAPFIFFLIERWKDFWGVE